MTTLPAVLTRFALNIGDLAAEFVTEQIGLQPSGILRKGQMRQPPRPPVAESSWEIEGPKRNIYSIDESVGQIVDIVWPKRHEILVLCREHGFRCLFVTAVWADDEHRPVYELSHVNLKKMSELEASWIMDVV
jgi:hypothetical protein